MRKILLPAFFWAISTSVTFCQTSLIEDFETWEQPSGHAYLQPKSWTTNNYDSQGNLSISVTKSSDSAFANSHHALKIISNGPGFEGPLSGIASKRVKVPANYASYNAISFYVKCPKITFPGKCILIVTEQSMDMRSTPVYWETSTQTDHYEHLTLPLHKLLQVDSLTITLMAQNQPGLSSQGYAEMLIDQIEFATLLGNPDNETFETRNVVYPNPTQDLVYFRENDFTSYTISELSGAKVAEGPLSQSTTFLSLAAYPSGTYLLKLTQTSGNSSYQKLIKK